MKSFIKFLVSLLVSISVFISLFLFFVTGVPKIETWYYQPAVMKYVKTGLEKIESSMKNWTEENERIFREFSAEGVLKRSLNQNQTDADIKLRETLTSDLILSVSGLMGVRIIESAGKRIHFSTFSSDIISKNGNLVLYRKYGRKAEDISYELIECEPGSSLKLNAETGNNAFIFSLPFFDDYNVFRGTIVFYVSAKAFARRLIAEKILTISDNLNLVTDENLSFVGIITGLPYAGAVQLKNSIAAEWRKGNTDLCHISDEAERGSPFWLLVSHKTENGFAGQLCEKDMFVFPLFARYFLITAASLSVFLITFLLLNLRQDKLFIAQNKIQKLHINIISGLIKNSMGTDRKELSEKLEYRRHETNLEIKKVLGKRLVKKYEKEIDEILKENWNNILSVINGKYNIESRKKSEMEEILRLLKQLVAGGYCAAEVQNVSAGQAAELLNISCGGVKSSKLQDKAQTESAFGKTDSAVSFEDGEKLENLEMLSRIEPFEELEEVESTDDTEIHDDTENSEDAEDFEDSFEEPKPVTETFSNKKTEDFDPSEILKDIEEVDEFEIAKNSAEDKNEEPPLQDGSEGEVDDFYYSSSEDQHFKAQEREAADKYSSMQVPTGLDFSFLDDDNEDSAAADLMYINENLDSKDSLKLNYQDKPVQGELEAVGDGEPYKLLEVNDEIIVNNNGIYSIADYELEEPKNKDFQDLVNSVIR